MLARRMPRARARAFAACSPDPQRSASAAPALRPGAVPECLMLPPSAEGGSGTERSGAVFIARRLWWPGQSPADVTMFAGEYLVNIFAGQYIRW